MKDQILFKLVLKFKSWYKVTVPVKSVVLKISSIVHSS